MELVRTGSADERRRRLQLEQQTAELERQTAAASQELAATNLEIAELRRAACAEDREVHVGGRPSDFAARALEARLLEAAKAGDADAVGWAVAGGASADAKETTTRPASGLKLHYPALVLAALRGNTAVVETLVRLGADVNAWSSDSFSSEVLTPLMAAAQMGHVDTVAALLEGGAAVDAVGSGGCTALEVAEANGHADVAALLWSELG